MSLPKHSELGASGYSRWKACPGSVALCRNIEKKSSSYADEGTKAHDIAANILLTEIIPDDLDQAFLDPIMVYVDYINALRAKDPDFEAVEQRFHIEQLHPKLFGTSDFVCYFKNTKTLHIVDFKFGAGVGVDATDEDGNGNAQLMYYGIGAIYANDFPIDSVVVTIVQPRFSHDEGAVRSFKASFGDIFEFQQQLMEDVLETEKPDAPLKLGKHCRWCAAQAVCPAKNQQALIAAREAFSEVEVITYDPKKLSATLDLLPQVESWCKSVREFAYREATSGRTVPGYKLVEKRAVRKWGPGVDAVKVEYTTGLDPTEVREIKLKSPAQIEKLLDKKDKHLLESLTVKESSGYNLAAETDKRVEIDIIKKAFEIIEN